ncbi:GMC oxidoreductase [Novosphingobium sp. RL4]|uniref:GMC oxidoreductase n=1 Tax=Novosphingobium sp. RL4 TaxID=3109595 RepID=UPI002D76FAF2|nr:GMC oxidoreductase [Novosphingobium sp. RL4]WRT94441.1 GMC oxidoreductase [Novosphingobium sp. RL4]
MTGAITIVSTDEARRFNADVIVVGSGAGSMAVAGELGRNGKKVLIVEAGPLLDSPPGRHRRNVLNAEDFLSEAITKLRPHGNSSEARPGLEGAASIHSVGGMLSYWSYMVPRPDFKWEWDNAISRDEFESYLGRAEDLLWATTSLFGDGSPRQRWIIDVINERFGPDFVRPADLAGRVGANGEIDFAAGDNLLAGGEAGLALLPDTVAVRLHHDGGQLKGLTVRHGPERTECYLEAPIFVVGGGTLGTPQLLHGSGIKLPALGRYLTDHLNLVSRVLLKSGDAPIDGPDDPPVWLRIPVGEGRDFQVGILDIPSTAHAGILQGADHLRTTDIGCFIGTDPVFDNRLSFDDETLDGLGLPSIRAHVELTQSDHDRVTRAFAMQYQLARTIGEPWQGMSPLLRPFGSSLHLMGTYRAGADPETSVTDGDCKVWGFENLYLAGNGLLGSLNHCNPTLTTVAFGLRAADAIVSLAK